MKRKCAAAATLACLVTLALLMTFERAAAGGAARPPAGAAAGAQPQEPTVTADEVAAAVARGVAFLRRAQRADGSWNYPRGKHVQGATALAVYALSQAGVKPDDPAIVKGMDYVLREPPIGTYEAACIAMAAASTNPAKYIKAIAQMRDYLVAVQQPNGMWDYSAGTVDRGGGDNSNTQFGLLGLHAAMSVGLQVPTPTLQAAYDHYARTQNADGGWGYRPNDISYGSMTAAAVGALDVLGSRLYVETVCGQYKVDPHLLGGFGWLAQNFTVTENPRKEPGWHLYYLYALERVGVFTGERYFAGHDWFLEGSRVVLDQQNPSGSWTSGDYEGPNTCFALLFLSKGNVPVLINKLAASASWNVDPYDAKNLTTFISGDFGQTVGWQTVTMKDSLETLLQAPILYVTGHQFPQFSQEEMEKLSAFFEHGGFMLAEACCGSKDFDSGFKAFQKRIFPEYRIERLDRSHLVYRLFFDIKGTKHPLYGVDAGCRTVIMYSPTDMSCAWQNGNVAADEEAFELGANIAAYVTGKERLASKLAQVKRIEAAAPRTMEAAPTAFTFAQAKYAGQWNPHAVAGVKLLEFLNDKAGLYVSSSPVAVALDDPNLANYPFLYMTGLSAFTLTAEEKEGLKEYLERGGFLFADATTGKPAFDQAFRSLMAELFPNAPLEAIPPDSDIYHAAFDTTHVGYTASVREISPNLTTFTLYGVTLGGRLAVAYSPYDIGCALEQQPAYGSRGLLSPDAFKAATNVVLYALTH